MIYVYKSVNIYYEKLKGLKTLQTTSLVIIIANYENLSFFQHLPLGTPEDETFREP